MLEARTGGAQAERNLRQFLDDLPDDPHVPRAYLALAEIAFKESPPDRNRVTAELTQVATEDSVTQEEKAPLEFFAATEQTNQPVPTISRLALALLLFGNRDWIGRTHV